MFEPPDIMEVYSVVVVVVVVEEKVEEKAE